MFTLIYTRIVYVLIDFNIMFVRSTVEFVSKSYNEECEETHHCYLCGLVFNNSVDSYLHRYLYGKLLFYRKFINLV